jgi:hypothetical protein
MASKVKPSTELPATLEVGMLIRFKTGDSGTYHVFDAAPNKDGSVRLYGGDSNPMGRRMFRAGRRAELQLEDRAEILRSKRVRS